MTYYSMNYIIDAYNVAFKDKNIAAQIRSGNTDAAITATVALVKSRLRSNKGKVTLVFDGKGHQATPRFSGLTVKFSKAPQKADDIIRDFIRKTPDAAQWTVISSDNEIRFTAQDHGAKAMTAKQFLALNVSEQKKQGAPQQKYNAENVDTEYWLNLFKNRPDDE